MTVENPIKPASKEEYILCAAIWYQDGNVYEHQPRNIDSGLVICGRRHHNCIATRIATRIDRLCPHVQGFLTNTDRFVDRAEAATIAKRAHQVEDFHIQKLYSEDLY